MAQSPASSPAERVTDPAQLVAWFQRGFERPENRRVGTEHEKLVLQADDLAPLTYDGPRGVRRLLTLLAERFNYQLLEDHGNPIALRRMTPNGWESITLEPGGQIELSGAPLRTLEDAEVELRTHLTEVGSVAQELGLLMTSAGLNGLHDLDQVNWMPKSRYAIMRDYMPRVGQLGRWMMKMTCTIQANLDFTSEADAADMLRTSLYLSPLVSALFANSPLMHGKPSGFHTARGHIWTQTDPDRCGFPLFMLESSDFGFKDYVEYTLDVPMYLIVRDGRYIDLTQERFTFRDFIHRGAQGFTPTLDDYETHIATLFPEVRLKRKYIEMRGADMGPFEHILALPALWKGLLYDAEARRDARALLDDLSPEQRQELFLRVTRWSLDAPIPGRTNGASATVRDLAIHMLRLAIDGLDRLASPLPEAPDAPPLAGPDEARYLRPMHDRLASGAPSRPEHLLQRWQELHGDTPAWLREQALTW